MSRRLTVVGDALLDRDIVGVVERVSPDAPAPVVEQRTVATRPGGAGLAAALLAADGREVTLVTALAQDAGARELRQALEGLEVEVVDIGRGGETIEKIRVRAARQTLLRVDRGVSGAVGAATPSAAHALEDAAGILVADYGLGVAAEPGIRRSLAAAMADGVPVVWDPHPKGAEPVRGVTLATPNRDEARRLVGGRTPADDARELRRRWSAGAVAVTLGPDGAVLVSGEGPPSAIPARPAVGGDPCGAGDRFASAAIAQLADGVAVSLALSRAVSLASAFVAAGGAGTARLEPRRPAAAEVADELQQTLELVASVRARGGRVVATGGCFDILHAGHVATLEAARALGDCLIVCLNSDDSVRQLKGPGRPYVGERDRAAVLSALGCVDAVVTFAEPTPVNVLEVLRPDVFAKGGDYSGSRLPEEDAIAAWGGELVLLPYLEGRSTTNLAEEVRRRVAG
jgi:rfaE bifunctional protein nucleotidyltransferase chain/domain/rfaE bifunctional protein kinase chain/domain